MFFKFQSIYRQFAQLSIRLLNSKLLSNSNVLLPSIKNKLNIANSPLRPNNRKGILKGGVISVFPFERRLLQSGHLNLLIKRDSNSSEENKINSGSISIFAENNEFIEVLNHSNKSKSHSNCHNYDMFPLLTGEELKAFDSSVYE